MRIKHVTAAAVMTLSGTAAIALAATKPTVKAAHNTALATTVVVDGAHGMTLYHLSPETRSHLLCTSTQCRGFWPPLTVSSRHVRLRKGPGITGKLGVFKRPDGSFQVTLRGMPLYRFAGDSGKDQSHGEGIQSFGGTWHAVTARTSSGAAAPTPAPTPSNPYPY